jgi:hypothetical protein
LKKATQRFWVLKQPKKAHDKSLILKPHRGDKSLNAVVAKIMKVRPQDPSNMA